MYVVMPSCLFFRVSENIPSATMSSTSSSKDSGSESSESTSSVIFEQPQQQPRWNLQSFLPQPVTSEQKRNTVRK